VDAAELVAACALVESARAQKNAEVSLTYFEFTTLAIFEVMRQRRLDVVILEVGLGGRLDAVNIIDPDCAIITSIDLDHTALLGPGPRGHRLREGRHHAYRQTGGGE
jgi:dihydrofolate synthase/folylpolyglutamate synthase